MRKSSARIKKAVYLAAIATSFWALANPVFSSALPGEHVIHLKGTTNTRDIGGYETGELATIRSGQIIRSDNLSRLSSGDFQKLEEMGLRTVIDLRSEQERDHSPTVWQGDNPPQFFHFPIGDSKNEWFAAQDRMMKIINKKAEERNYSFMNKRADVAILLLVIMALIIQHDNTHPL